jgi:putative heme-binding domain-containing protein
LARSADAETRATLFKHFPSLALEDQAAVVDQLVTRAASARELLDAVAEAKVPRGLINSLHARQILRHNDAGLRRQLTEIWGEIRATSSDKDEAMRRFKSFLTPERLRKADLSQGRALFNKTCSSCHRLYGEGNTVGPDLTGSGRSHLDYLLENLIDPSAMVPADYRVSHVELKDDRVLSGVVVSSSDRTIELQAQTERLVLDRADIVQVQQGTLSLMPEGILEALPEDEVRDLIAYLIHEKQVPLPPTP